ncbi:MAG: acyl carrier protein [Gammaproteobacteria bacterium]|nr:acyl carrier protein [Gammaproteobacteria bacterium]
MQKSVEEAVQRRVLEVFKDVCGQRGQTVDPLPDTTIGALGLESLQLVEVVFELESCYQVQVDEEQLAQLESVADVIEMFSDALQRASQQMAPQQEATV